MLAIKDIPSYVDGRSAAERVKQPRKWFIRKGRLKGKRLYFIVNTDQQARCRLNIGIRGCGAVTKLEPLNGGQSDIPVQIEERWTYFEYEMPSRGSLLVAFDPLGDIKDKTENTKREIDCKSLTGDWELQLLEHNTITLDLCSYSLNAGNEALW